MSFPIPPKQSSSAAFSTKGQRATPRYREVWNGVSSALLSWFVLRELGVLDLLPWWRGEMASIFAALLFGAALGLTRVRLVPQIVALGSVGLWLVVAFTPLAAALSRPLVRAQSPVRADAVVVLLASIQEDDDFGTPSLERTLHGIGFVRRNAAPRLILTQGTRPQGSHRAAAMHLMADLKIHCPLTVVGPAKDTHDEALHVRALARQEGWKRILLVTSPLHSRRAALVFEKTGLRVTSVPCRETSFDLEALEVPTDRLRAFSAAPHEIVGLRVYRARDWI